jgi:hypothetical protein
MDGGVLAESGVMGTAGSAPGRGVAGIPLSKDPSVKDPAELNRGMAADPGVAPDGVGTDPGVPAGPPALDKAHTM